MGQKLLVIVVLAMVALSSIRGMHNNTRIVAVSKLQNKAVIAKKNLVKDKLHNKQLKVAVIDTGIAPYVKTKLGCDAGHYDFTGTGLYDRHGHGTHISGLIHINSGQLDKKKYCQIYLKFYEPGEYGLNNLANMKKALKMALQLKVDIVNISAGGSWYDSEEHLLIDDLLNHGIIVVTAAGNEGRDISDNKKVRYYPASYDTRIIVVGNRVDSNERAPSSNYGSNVVNWEKGVDITSFGLYEGTWIKMSGTSQAAAIKTGKILRETVTGASF